VLKAFGKYKRVMTSVYPDRRAELDAYEDDIIDIYNFFGSKFYDYHKLFSSKAAVLSSIICFCKCGDTMSTLVYESDLTPWYTVFSGG
jgi:hypothetical protein